MHAHYVVSVSPEAMAASLPTCAYLLWLCQMSRPSRVVDLGSGLSSGVLRLYQANSDRPVDVRSIDTEADWLEKTRTFLEDDGLQTTGLETWADFRSTAESRSYDIVFHDLAQGELRNEAMDVAFDLVSTGGMLVVDDVHARAHADHLRYLLSRNRSRRWLNVRRLTLDQFGRYAAIVVPRTLSNRAGTVA